jgi:hypothetical protein
MEVFYLLVAAFSLFILWLCSKIVEKAGIEKIWVLTLLVPVVNVIMVWVFAFSDWPGVKGKRP